jgi:hypothetical protein
VRPLEIRVALGIYLIGAAVFIAVGAARGDGALAFPIIAGVFGVLAAAGLWLRWRWAGQAAFLVSAVVALGHLLIVLDPAPWGLRVLSGVLAAAHLYAGVLVMTKPAREYLGTAT